MQPNTTLLITDKKSQEDLLHNDPMLRHLNPEYKDKDFTDFIKKYNLSRELKLESFNYNKQANEENFMRKIAVSICDECAKRKLLYKEYFMKFNPTYREFLKL